MAADNAQVLVSWSASRQRNRNSSEAQGQVAGSSASQIGGQQFSRELIQTGGESEKDVYFLFVPVVLALPPGLIDSPGDGVKVITVGAADNNGHIAGIFRIRATRDDRIKPDVVAPGVDIISTVPTGGEKGRSPLTFITPRVGPSLSAHGRGRLSALLLQATETSPRQASRRP